MKAKPFFFLFPHYTHTYLLITLYYPAAYRICMFHRIMHPGDRENYDHFSASMHVYWHDQRREREKSLFGLSCKSIELSLLFRNLMKERSE